MLDVLVYHPRTVAATILGAAAIAVPSVLSARTMLHARPVSSPMIATSVGWADRVFVRPGELAHWLRRHGVGYTVWASRHPQAARRLGRA